MRYLWDRSRTKVMSRHQGLPDPVYGLRTNRAMCLILACLPALGACTETPEPELIAGGLYSIEDGRGEYRAAKLLAYDSSTVNLVLFSNRYEYRPDTIRADSLRMVPAPEELRSREHFAASRRLFKAWEPELAGLDSVTSGERLMVGQWIRSGRRAAGEQNAAWREE